MTWFEIEQIAGYMHELERSMDDWVFNNMEMRTKLVELGSIEKKLHSACFNCRKRNEDPLFCNVVDELQQRAENCKTHLRERLMR